MFWPSREFPLLHHQGAGSRVLDRIQRIRVVRNRASIFLVVSAVLLSFLGACTPVSEEAVPPAQNELAFPLDVTDQMGRQLRIERVPERIVSLSPSNTEIVYALGLEDKLVGVTEYCDYPEAAKDKPKIGGFNTVDDEKIVEIQPDLVLATEIHTDEVIPHLERLGLTVLAITPKTLSQVLAAINLIGKCTGRKEEAARLVDEMEGRIKAIADKTGNLTQVERPRVFYVTWHNPLMTVGSEARHDELIQVSGGINIFHDLADDYPTVSLEAVINANPEVIIAGTGMGSGEDSPLQLALTEPRLKDVDARIRDRVYGVHTDLVARPGPRIADGLEWMAGVIHPEIFPELFLKYVRPVK